MFELTKPDLIYTAQSSRSSSTDRLSSLPSLAGDMSGTHSPSLIKANQQQLITHYRTLATQFKKLTQQSSPLEKSNYLRVTVLKFLRLDQQPVERHDPDLRKAIEMFSKYWNFLLIDLLNQGSSFSSTDRSCYLEVISRLMSRKEWKFAVGTSETLAYRNLLVSTVYYIQKKLFPLKKIPNSINSFIGKVQCYAFFTLPHFGDIILFSLKIRNETMCRYKPTASNPTNFQHIFPEHLSKYINYTGNLLHYKSNEFLNEAGLNCLSAPSDLVFQITNDEITDSMLIVSVKDWGLPPLIEGTIRSRSFLKHYLEHCLTINTESTDYQSFVSGIPGGYFIFSAIFQVFLFDYNSLCAIKTSNLTPTRTVPLKTGSSYASSNLQESATIQKQKNVDRYQSLLQSSITSNKILQIMKDLLCDPKISRLPYSEAVLVNSLESLLIEIAKTIDPYHGIDCGVINDLFMRLCCYLYDNDFELNMTRLLDWGFWLTGISRMLESNNMGSQKAAISCLFNLWEVIPSNYRIEKSVYGDERWVCDLNHGLTANVSLYLISKPIWRMLFIHWSELIRHLYQRLIIFKVIGTKDKDDFKYITNSIIKNNQDSVEERLLETLETFLGNFHSDGRITSYDLFPSEPVLNQKLIIAPMHKEKQQPVPIDLLKKVPSNILDKISASTVNPVYVYDIFDEAIYTSTGTKPPSNRGVESSLTTPSKIIFPHSKSPIRRSMSSKSLSKFFDLITSPSISSSSDTTTKLTNMAQRSMNSSPNLSSPSFLQKPFGSSSSLSSLPSSTIIKNGSNSSLNLQDLSMDSIPLPPELLHKSPPRAMYKYAFLLVPNPESDSIKYKGEILSNNTRKFWTITEFFGSSVKLPTLPNLPFLTNAENVSQSSNLQAQIHQKRLENNRRNFDSNWAGSIGDYDLNLSDSSSSLDIYDKRFLSVAKMRSKPWYPTSYKNQTSLEKEHYDNSIENELFNKMKNYSILGRALNEWELNVQEYEKYVSLVTEDFDNRLYGDDNMATWFLDPFLNCESGVFKGAY